MLTVDALKLLHYLSVGFPAIPGVGGTSGELDIAGTLQAASKLASTEIGGEEEEDDEVLDVIEPIKTSLLLIPLSLFSKLLTTLQYSSKVTAC